MLNGPASVDDGWVGWMTRKRRELMCSRLSFRFCLVTPLAASANTRPDRPANNDLLAGNGHGGRNALGAGGGAAGHEVDHACDYTVRLPGTQLPASGSGRAGPCSLCSQRSIVMQSGAKYRRAKRMSAQPTVVSASPGCVRRADRLRRGTLQAMRSLWTRQENMTASLGRVLWVASFHGHPDRRERAYQWIDT